MSLKRILVGTAIGGAILGGWTYFRRLGRTSAQLQTVTRVSVFKINLKGLTLQVDVNIKNPSQAGFKIKFPFVKLGYKGQTIGTSQSVNQDITVPAYGEAVASKIMIVIPIMGLFSIGGGLIAAIQSGGAVNVEVTTITTIDLGIKKLPYQKTETVTIK
jgi:hypothetical protein